MCPPVFISERSRTLPGQLLADANHASHSCIEAATRAGVEPIIAIPKRERCATKPVSPEVEAWRERMKTDEAKRAYRARAALCELSNAHLKCHHGTAAVLVRGLAKVTCVALLGAIAANVLAHCVARVARVAVDPRADFR